MKICSKCDTSNADAANFCKTCGTSLTDLKVQDVFRCSEGHIINTPNEDCPVCKEGEIQNEQSFNSVHKTEQVPPSKQSSETDNKNDLNNDAFSHNQKNRDQTNKLYAFLVTFSHLTEGEFYPIYVRNIKIGRCESQDISIGNDLGISSEHSILFFQESYCYLKDNNSTNGTFLNDENITHPIQLCNYDSIRIGETTFRFVMINPPVQSENESNDNKDNIKQHEPAATVIV